MGADLLDRVAELDPAPSCELSDQEQAFSAELLRTIMSAPNAAAEPAQPRRRHRAAFVIVAAAAAAAVIAIVATIVVSPSHTPTSAPEALGPQGLSAASVASWTATPSPLPSDAPVVAFCERSLKIPGAAALSNRDLRGEVGSVIVTVGGYSAWCTMGSDGLGMYLLMDAPGTASAAPLAPGQVTLGPVGAHGLTGPGLAGVAGFVFASGRAASDVTKVVVKAAGRSVTATLDGGTWTAWWPVDDYERALDASAARSSSIIVTRTSGAVVSYGFEKLEAQWPAT